MNNRQFLIVIVVTFIVIIIWIIADILHTRPSVEINPKLTTLLSPINPNFDSKVIEQINEVTSVDKMTIEINSNNRFTATTQTNATRSAQPLVNPSSTPLPFPSALIPSFNASASANPGGNQ